MWVCSSVKGWWRAKDPIADGIAAAMRCDVVYGCSPLWREPKVLISLCGWAAKLGLQ
jgi:hypothetical protein